MRPQAISTLPICSYSSHGTKGAARDLDDISWATWSGHIALVLAIASGCEYCALHQGIATLSLPRK